MIDWIWTDSSEDDDETSAFGLNEWRFESEEDED